MTRNEYLEKLNHALAFLEYEIRQSTLAFYQELLDDRMEDGMTEEDAVAAMEDAELIAGRMRQEHGEYERTAAQNAQTDAFMPCTITYAESDLSSVTCVFMDRPVVIEPSDSQALVISYTENVNEPLEYTENGGHISLVEKISLARRNFTLFGIHFGNVLDPLFRGKPQMDTAVRIRVPADMLLALDITTSKYPPTASLTCAPPTHASKQKTARANTCCICRPPTDILKRWAAISPACS